MIENAVKTKLKNGTPVYGILSGIYDPAVVEVAGRLGFDLYMMDGEHSTGGPTQAEHFVRACETVGMTPFARVRSADPKLILQYMDAGIMGVMLPGVTGPDDVARLVEAAKYPPLGRRGIAAIRANDYLLGSMSQGEYVPFANEQTIILPQIETVEAVNCLDSLLQIGGVDGFIVGPRDLSMSMGFPDGPAHTEVREMVDHLFKAVRAAGLVVGTVAGTGAEAQNLIERGAHIVLGSINGLLKVGAAEFLGRRG